MQRVLEELEQSGFISMYVPFGKKKKSKLYRLTDEYSLFYLQFINMTQKELIDHLNTTLTDINKEKAKFPVIVFIGEALASEIELEEFVNLFSIELNKKGLGEIQIYGHYEDLSFSGFYICSNTILPVKEYKQLLLGLISRYDNINNGQIKYQLSMLDNHGRYPTQQDAIYEDKELITEDDIDDKIEIPTPEGFSQRMSSNSGCMIMFLSLTFISVSWKLVKDLFNW